MIKAFGKTIEVGFYLLFSLIPLIIFPHTSEIFEFNKIVLVYLITIILSGSWLAKMVIKKEIIFTKTGLTIPLIIFLISQILATLFSIDTRSSLLGYYSRFNGGLLSTVCYTLLYFIYVSNAENVNTKKSLSVLFASTFLTSIWGIFEHFGHSFSCLIFPEFKVFDVSCWVQDVRTRVFASFGQPNWLAAWLVAIIPIAWGISVSENLKLNGGNFLKLTTYNLLPVIFFVTLLFTKSRSGILAFIISYLIFWTYYLFSTQVRMKVLKNFVFVSSFLIFTCVLIGSPWTPSLKEFLSKNKNSLVSNDPPQVANGPALESGGTESGKIRQIVWRGALDVWKKYPVFGSGVETFAFSYYGSRPAEHNLTSEWDYLYNKAHNEYLNYAATTGTLGLIAYVYLILSTLKLFLKFQFPSSSFWGNQRDTKNDSSTEENKLINLGLMSGYISILVTNFFGFSTAPTSVLFFLLPAMIIPSNEQRVKNHESNKLTLSNFQKFNILIVLILTSYFLVNVLQYWFADYTYAKGKLEKEMGNYQKAAVTMTNLTKKSPTEAIYWDELSDILSLIALQKTENSEEASEFTESSYAVGRTAVELSPYSVTLKRKLATRLINLSGTEPSYLTAAKNMLEELVVLAPTDAKISYNLSLSYLRTGDYKKAIDSMEKTVSLKPDYERARYALALMYDDMGMEDEAKYQIKYILEKLNPTSEEAKQELQELEN